MAYQFTKLNIGDSVASNGAFEFKKLGTEMPDQEIGNYLVFSSPNSFTLSVVDKIKYWDGTLEYSTDANTWNIWSGTSAISSSADGKLYMRGTGNTVITGSTATSTAARWVLAGSNISCGGNIETLLDYATVKNGEHPTMADNCFRSLFRDNTSIISSPELPATTLASYCYYTMFYKCKALTTAPELPAATVPSYGYYYMFGDCTALTTVPDLQATTVGDYGCYSMFQGCTSLKTPPKLYATTLGNRSYRSMFYGCTALTTAPELPAANLGVYCYGVMFYNCISLTTAPELNATVLAEGCYQEMFYNCAKLNVLPKLPATTLAKQCYYRMFYSCVSIKLSTTYTGNYTTTYRIPIDGTGTTATNALYQMFTSTGGTFKGTPSINKIYYTENTLV